MLCCGLMAFIAAAAVGLWRWLRAFPRTILAVGGAAVLAVPVLALAASQPAAPLSRADVVQRAMQALCGER